MLDPEKKRHFWLYILLLEQNRYYVGTTAKHDWQERINEHSNGFYTAQWVRKYPLLATIKVTDLGMVSKIEAEQYESEQTLLLMKEHGYQNVRGGSFNYSGKYLKVGNKLIREDEFWGKLGMLIMTISALVLAAMAWR